MYKTSKQRTGLVILLGAIAALGPFSIDMYLPGFPSIATDFGVAKSEVSLTLTSYFIGISIGQLAYGPLLDRFGRKQPLLWGIFFYLLSSIGCAVAPSLGWLIGFRFFQALGGCVGMVACTAIIRDLFAPTEVAKKLSSILLVMGAAPIIAPSIGTLISATLGWRYIFGMIVVVAALLLVLIYQFLKETKLQDTNISLHPKAIVHGYLAVFRNTQFTLYALSGSISMAILFAYISAIPFIVMNIYGLSEQTFAWLFGLNAFGFILGSQVNRVALNYMPVQQLTFRTSLLQVIIATAFLVSAYFFQLPIWIFIAGIFSILFLLGFINPNATALSLSPFSTNAGSASALNGSIRMGAGAAVSALIGLLYNGTIFPLLYFLAVLSAIAFLLLIVARRKMQRVAVAAN